MQEKEAEDPGVETVVDEVAEAVAGFAAEELRGSSSNSTRMGSLCGRNPAQFHLASVFLSVGK